MPTDPPVTPTQVKAEPTVTSPASSHPSTPVAKPTASSPPHPPVAGEPGTPVPPAAPPQIGSTSDAPTAASTPARETSLPSSSPVVVPKCEPESPCSSSARKGKGGRKAANPHLTDEERRRERVLKNRESAMKSLQKKKRYTEDLEHKAIILSKRNAELKEKIRALVARLSHQVPLAQPLGPHQHANLHPSAIATAAQMASQLGDNALATRQMQHVLVGQAHGLPQQQHGGMFPQGAMPGNKGTAQTGTTVMHRPDVTRTDAVSMSSGMQTAHMTTQTPAAPSFSPIDDWVPALSDTFMSTGTTSLSTPMNTQTSQSLPCFPPTSSYQATQPSHDQEDDVGDSFMGLGINVALGLGNTSTAMTSPALGMQQSIPPETRIRDLSS